MKKALLFYSKTICYNSCLTFTESIMHDLENKGWDCTFCDMSKGQKPEKFAGKSFDAIIDFNSTLPQVRNEAGNYLLDSIDGPFYNFILDHPLYHHDSLSSGMKNQIAMCLDRKHLTYIKRFYPGVRSAKFAPLGIMSYEKSQITKLAERPIDVLFTGTFTSEEFYMSHLIRCNSAARDDISAIAQILMDNPAMAMEDAMEKFIDDHGGHGKISDVKFAEYCHLYFLADTIAAARFRSDTIRSLLRGGTKLTVCGHGWDKFARESVEMGLLSSSELENLTILPERDYESSLKLAYDSKILLNVMPLFRDGIHDRIPTAMGHGAVAMSDESVYLNEILSDKENYLLYSLMDLKTKEPSEKVAEALSDINKLQRIADAGHCFAEENFKWPEL